MKLTNRLYSNPVLTLEKDDYLNSVFETSYSYEMSSVNTLLLNFTIEMTNEELEEQIYFGNASYAIHLECSRTGYRKIVKSSEKQFTHEIQIADINGTLDVVSFIVANEEIIDFYSDDWNEDYEDLTLTFKKGTILGYESLNSLDISKENYEFKNASSIFKVQHIITEDPKPMEVILKPDKICIHLCTRDYKLFIRYSNKTQYQPLIHSMIIFPTLIYVFEELKQENGVEENQSKRWYIALNNSYRTRGIDLLTEINNEDKSSVQLAQEAMDDVIGKALQSLVDLEGYEEEY